MANRPFTGTRYFVANKAQSISAVLEQNFRISPDRAKELVGIGAIYCNKQRITKDKRLKPKDTLRLYTQPKRYQISKINWKAVVVYEQNDFIVINKPAGIPIHPMLDNQVESVLHQLRLHFSPSLWVTQRLDIATSGLAILAKSKSFQAYFNQLLKEGSVQKIYQAQTAKRPPMGKHLHYMKPTARAPRIVSTESHPNWLQCKLEILEVKEIDPYYEATIDLLTGRTHQIRCQLAALGCPIIGDKLYGSKPHRNQRLALRAQKLRFPLPNGKAFSFNLANSITCK